MPLHMINVQILGEPTPEQQAIIDGGNYLTNVWQGEMQQIPANMRGNPVGFASGLANGLPGLRRIRMAFNQHSFGADGNFHPQMETFMAEATAQGFTFVWVLMDGPSQETGNTDHAELNRDWPDSYPLPMTSEADWLALMPMLAQRHTTAWTRLLAWLARNPAVVSDGFEAINEPASYGRGATKFPALRGQIIQSYVDHVLAIHSRISAVYPNAWKLVGGWNYSATFEAFEERLPNGLTAMQQFKAALGNRLVWSAHLYPQWGGNQRTPQDMDIWLSRRFAPVMREPLVMTEINAQNEVANQIIPPTEDARSTFMLMRTDWFAKHDVGIGWWPVVNYASGFMLYISGQGTTRQHQQNTYGAAYGLFTANSQNRDIFSTDATFLRRCGSSENNNALSDPDRAVRTQDPVQAFNIGFGCDAPHTLTSDPDANAFLYGGAGRAILIGSGQDDNLQLGSGGGVIRAGAGYNVVTARGGDCRIYTGPTHTRATIYAGRVDLIVHPAGVHQVRGFAPAKGDRLSFMGAFPNVQAFVDALSVVPAGSSIADETILRVALPSGGWLDLIDCPHLLPRLHRVVLDFTSGWYAAGWTEPPDSAPGSGVIIGSRDRDGHLVSL